MKSLLEATLHQRTARRDDDDELGLREKVPTDKACARQFVGEQSALIIMAVPH
jgi:hypothetical protein